MPLPSPRIYWPIYGIVIAAFVGTIFLREFRWVFAERWSLSYLLITPFLHGSALHFLLNALGLHFIGGQMLLPLIGVWRFLLLFAAAAFLSGVVNNFLSSSPAIGMSGAVLAMLSCVVFPYGQELMRFMIPFVRLPTIRLWKLVVVLIFIDICGIIFSWQVFAHWSHLCGFLVGGVAGVLFFRWRV